MRFKRWTHSAIPLDESWKFLAQEYNEHPEYFWTQRGAARAAEAKKKILGGAVRFEIHERRK
jgi:hypothetical protein